MKSDTLRPCRVTLCVNAQLLLAAGIRSGTERVALVSLYAPNASGVTQLCSMGYGPPGEMEGWLHLQAPTGRRTVHILRRYHSLCETNRRVSH